MPNVKPWKRFEAAMAKAVGTRRLPVTGERDGADFATPMFIYSAKHRKGQFPVTVARWLERVVQRAQADEQGRIGVVVVQKPRARYADALVVLRWTDWCALHANRRPEDEVGILLTEKAVQHIESGCQLAPGHDGPCLTEDDVEEASR